MDTLKAMQVFIEVANQRGFAPAAKKLELSTSSVSRQVANLETQLNCQLFNRTTRSLTLTHSGRDMLERCQRIVHDTEDLLQSSRDASAELAGRLRITMPLFMARWLSGMIAEYVTAHPRISLDLVVLTRVVNLVEEDFDLAIRVGYLPDSTLIARKLFDLKLVMVAAPAYLVRHGEPDSPRALRDHHCIVDTESPYKNRWTLIDGNRKRSFRIRINARVNNGEIARALAVGGVGLALLPQFLVADDLKSGKLRALLPASIPAFGGVFAVYPGTRHLPRAVRSFIEMLVWYCSIRGNGSGGGRPRSYHPPAG